MSDKVLQIGILGSGLMGKQIAVLCASRQLPVLVWNHIPRPNSENECRRLALIESKRGYIDKGVLENLQKLIRFESDMRNLSNCDIIIETIKEDEQTKRDVLEQVSKVLRSKSIVATNTSTLSISSLATLLPYAQRFIGVHFFNPAISTKLAEVVRGKETLDIALTKAVEFLKVVGKCPVILPETPGNVVNRLLFPMINEAVMLLSRGVADAGTIDSCMKLGAQHPMGPLELADFIGLDVCQSILETLVAATGEAKYAPSPFLKEYVKAGKLGRKTGEGFYSYRRRPS